MHLDFVHLHVHSYYSMMQGASSPRDLCREAKKAGFTHLALTDTNGFYGLINFLEAARANGIEPIVGAVVQSGVDSAVLLARTPKGFEIISDLVTRRHLRSDFSLLANLPEKNRDIIFLGSDPGQVKDLRDRFECYLEIVPGPMDRKLLHASRNLGIPPVATNGVNFATEADYSLHRLLRAIDLNKTLSTLAPSETAASGRWLKNSRQMAAYFPNCPEALANAAKIALSCHTAWKEGFKTVFPYYMDKEDDHFALLLSECRKGISWRYGKTDDAIETRLREELDLIRSKGFVDYFLVVADIVRRRPIHCGRGSGAASLVSYLLGITHVDPIRHKLLFGRFLNPERKDLPDIDVDFPWDERDGLFEEIRRHYGDERLALVSNHIGFGARASVREVAKVFGIAPGEIKEVTRRMNFWAHPEGLWEHIRNYPKFKNFPLDPPWPEIIDLASKLESIPRHIGTHCGGVVVVPDRLTRYVPVEISAKGVPIIQWEKDQTEKAGLVKIDLLGNRSLAVIRDTIASIRENTGKIIDYPNFNPVDDLPTRDMIAQGKTIGVFYLESPSIRLLQAKSRQGDFDHLVIHSSIIRPAANRFILDYLRRLHGEPYEPLHPGLKDLLAESYGILVYQEDVVQAAMIMAGFTWGEADGLRKVISKKSREQLSSYKVRFTEGCTRNGISPEVIEKVWEMFTSFAGYSFCKPHSASYALVSVKSAYLKLNYPAEFMAAVISNGGGYYSTFAYISEARRMGLTVKGPDINRSRIRYTGKGKTVRVGFQQLQNVRQATVDSILEERERHGPFLSLEDLLRRVTIQQSDAVVLARSGALDSISNGLNRPQILWFLESWLNRFAVGNRQRTALPASQNGKKLRHGNAFSTPRDGRKQQQGSALPAPQNSLKQQHGNGFPGDFAGVGPAWNLGGYSSTRPGSDSTAMPEKQRPLFLRRQQTSAFTMKTAPVKVPPLPDFTEREKWSHEWETLGFVLSVHPLDLAEPFFRSTRRMIVSVSDFPAHVGKKIWVKAWPISRKEVYTREGVEMEFFTFEDKTGIFETVFFPKAFERFCQDLDMSHAYLLHGRVESEFGVVTLNVEYAYRVTERVF